eukprot:TRINITY_DN19322_c0_g1_i1.p1 TRINITY_DN19322_c0_g1~~TRINITY_DN19322_c0_g1_i1.p1  ORF type:complete len:254 (-),score=25.58 TRINITY_DN19322_c0_g1_i1:121-882(-)
MSFPTPSPSAMQDVLPAPLSQISQPMIARPSILSSQQLEWVQQLPSPERQPLQPVDNQAAVIRHFAPQSVAPAIGGAQLASARDASVASATVTREVHSAERTPLELPIDVRRTSRNPPAEVSFSQLTALPAEMSPLSYGKDVSFSSTSTMPALLSTALAGMPSPARASLPRAPAAFAAKSQPAAVRRMGVNFECSPVTPSPAGRTVLPNFPSPGPLGSPISGSCDPVVGILTPPSTICSVAVPHGACKSVQRL